MQQIIYRSCQFHRWSIAWLRINRGTLRLGRIVLEHLPFRHSFLIRLGAGCCCTLVRERTLVLAFACENSLFRRISAWIAPLNIFRRFRWIWFWLLIHKTNLFGFGQRKTCYSCQSRCARMRAATSWVRQVATRKSKDYTNARSWKCFLSSVYTFRQDLNHLPYLRHPWLFRRARRGLWNMLCHIFWF